MHCFCISQKIHMAAFIKCRLVLTDLVFCGSYLSAQAVLHFLPVSLTQRSHLLLSDQDSSQITELY